MKLVRCKNRFRNEEGKTVDCNRVLGFLTDMQFDMLHLDPEGGPVFRCARCHPEQRWVKVEGNEKTRKTAFRVLDSSPEFGKEIRYDELIICEQVG